MSAKDLYVGVDVGATGIKCGVAADGPELLWMGTRPTRTAEGRAAVLEAIADAASDAFERARLLGGKPVGIGVGTPGVVDPATGRIRQPTSNMPDWKGADIPGLLQDRLGVPVCIDNDGNVAALAEARWGAARGHQHVLMSTIGTGIGGGALVDGHLLRGAWGAGMELGHIPLIENGLPCPCGQRGCLEAYSGGRGMRRRWIELLAEAGAEGWDGIPADALAIDHLLAAAAAGESNARDTLESAAGHLATGLITALYLLNPEVIVLGGGIIDGVPGYFERIEEEIRARSLAKVLEKLQVREASLGNRAGTVGAITLFREERALHG